jgi:hypothetical protein
LSSPGKANPDKLNKSLVPPASFRFYRLRFHFRCEGPLFLPAGKAGNVIRGALGSILRTIACDPACPGARTCGLRNDCAYARIFEPVASAGSPGPSGLQDPPRPFVLRASHLDGASIPAGQTFSFDIHLFLTRNPPLQYFVLAFSQLAETGLGPSRGRVWLETVDLLLDVTQDSQNLARIFGNGRFAGAASLPEPLALPLQEESGPPDDAAESPLRIRFRTPLELKQNGQIASRPEFGLLIARIAERLSNLSAMYGDGPLDWDWRGLVERSKAVQLVEMRIAAEDRTTRFSTKTRQTHSLGGIRGEALYRGAIREFIPMLRAAKYCGIGRHTVWGNGVLEIAEEPRP